MTTFRDLLAKHLAKWMIWEGVARRRNPCAKLAAIGVKSVVFDPCGNRPEKEIG